MENNRLSTASSILQAWCKYHYQPVLSDHEEIMCTVIWGNSLLRRENKPMFDKELVNSNVERVSDIVHPLHRRLMTYNEFTDVFGRVISPLRYCGILATLPKTWRHSIQKMRFFNLCRCQPLPLPNHNILCLCHLFFLSFKCRKK